MMPITYQNPLEDISEPETVKENLSVALDAGTTHHERQEAISFLKGVCNFYRKSSKHKAVVVYLRGMISKAQVTLYGKEGQDV